MGGCKTKYQDSLERAGAVAARCVFDVGSNQATKSTGRIANEGIKQCIIDFHLFDLAGLPVAQFIQVCRANSQKGWRLLGRPRRIGLFFDWHLFRRDGSLFHCILRGRSGFFLSILFTFRFWIFIAHLSLLSPG